MPQLLWSDMNPCSAEILLCMLLKYYHGEALIIISVFSFIIHGFNTMCCLHFWHGCSILLCADTYDTPEAKAFFEQNYSYIYYIFYDVFTNVESDLKQRGKLTGQKALCSIWLLFYFCICPGVALKIHTQDNQFDISFVPSVFIYCVHNILYQTQCLSFCVEINKQQ